METEFGSLSFEQAFQELEDTVRKLSDGDLTLEEAVALFERGARLAQVCNGRLDTAQLRVNQLLTGPDGTPQVVPFEQGA